MPTRQGWTVALVGVGLLVAGRIFGIEELYVLGAGAVAVVALAVTYARRLGLTLSVQRTLVPPRVYAGNPSRVDLSVRNEGQRTSPVLRLLDPVTSTRGADVLVGPLAPGVTSQAAYRLPTDRRGIVLVGPLSVQVGDPFGFASVGVDAAAREELTVYPRLDEIAPVPHTVGDDPLSGAEHAASPGRAGDEFHSLRAYVVGDDLRRVHWKATARRDELMVRQDEMPWQGRLTVLLDTRRAGQSVESFEACVSAAASIITASWRRRDLVRLATTDGADLGFAAGSAHAEAIMERLAVVQVTSGGSLRGMVETLRGGGHPGALVIIVAGLTDADRHALAGLLGRHRSTTTVVHFTDAPAQSAGASGAPAWVTVGAGDSFATAWNRAVPTRSGAPAWVGMR